MKCDCGCDAEELILHARCHLWSPTWAVYNTKHKTLTIKCAECMNIIVVFENVKFPDGKKARKRA